MAISKKFLKSKPVCKVTFELEGVEAETVVAVGDFNNWNTANSSKTIPDDKPRRIELLFLGHATEHCTSSYQSGIILYKFSK